MDLKKRRLIMRYREFYVPAGIIGVCLLIFLFGIIPAAQKTNELVQETSVKQKELDTLKKKLAVLDSLDEQQLEDQLKIANSAIPIEKSIPSIMQTIETAANDVGMTISSINLSGVNSLATESARGQTEIDKEFGAFTIPFAVNTSATFDTVRAFLEKTAAVRRFVRVRRFNLSTVDETESQTQIGFYAFYLPIAKSDLNKMISPLSSKEETVLSSVDTLINYAELITNPTVGSAEIIQNPGRNPFQ